MVTKRGQAAMEFLMTYGWALLVVLVAIGALAFFGVLNPGQFLPSSCNMFPGLACTDFKVDDAEGVNVIMVLQNGLGSDMSITGITLGGDGTACVSESALATEIGTCTAFPCTLSDGKSVTVSIDCGTNPTLGGKFKSGVTIAYTLSGSTLSHSKTGQIVSAVE